MGIATASAGGEEMVSRSHTTTLACNLSCAAAVPTAAGGSLDCATAPNAEHGLVGLRESTFPPGEHRVGLDINIDVCTIFGVSTSSVDARKRALASSDM